MKKENIINKIIDAEWEMFVDVKNIGGPAPCQQDPKTFKIMRQSQFFAWSEHALKSYFVDLELAKKEKRNLLGEKYARMMKYTMPKEYDNISHLLCAVASKDLRLINKIVRTVLNWEEEFSKKFPFLREKGRPLYSKEDSDYTTSVETYLRAELATYSSKTLHFYYDNIQKQKVSNINAVELTILQMVRAYGYRSLEEANEKLKKINKP